MGRAHYDRWGGFGTSRRALRPDRFRSEMPTRVLECGEHRRDSAWGWRGPGIPQLQSRFACGIGVDGGALSQLEPYCLQRAAVSERRIGSACDRYTQHGRDGRTFEAHAAHRSLLPHWFTGDIRDASIQRFHQRVADVSIPVAELPSSGTIHQSGICALHCLARPHGRPGCGMLRSSIRNHISGAPTGSGR